MLMFFKKISITLIIILTCIFQCCNIYAKEVYLGGDSIGISLNYDGVLITGTYDIQIDNNTYNPKSDGIEVGDLIVEVNHSTIHTINDFTKIIKDSSDPEILLVIHRGENTLEKSIKFQRNNETFSTGLYVQDKIGGIGTLTYYDPSTNRFGALGHLMSKEDGKSSYVIKNGSIYLSAINKINKSYDRLIGEKNGSFKDVKIGTIDSNCDFGIYGVYDNAIIANHNIIETGSKDDISTGNAYMYTVVSDTNIERFKINITKLIKQKDKSAKGIWFEITDENLLSISHGIVQGMSGSPIVQGDKLVGCVTHVNVEHPNLGYGLYIEYMLDN